MNSEPPVNQLEVMGLLSARLIHTLANHLAVITGNLSAAARLARDPVEADEALRGAIEAANATGALLDDAAACRRGLREDSGEFRPADLAGILEEWCASKPSWRVSADSPARAPLSVPLSRRMIRFVLEAIVEETRPGSGEIHLKRVPPRVAPHLLTGGCGCVAAVSLTFYPSAELDWSSIRTNFKRPRLAAAWEIIAQMHGRIETARTRDGLTTLTLPIPVSDHEGSCL